MGLYMREGSVGDASGSGFTGSIVRGLESSIKGVVGQVRLRLSSGSLHSRPPARIALMSFSMRTGKAEYLL